MRLVLVRHGLSSFNAKGLIQGRTDDSFLTDEGYEQALKAVSYTHLTLPTTPYV